MKLALVLSCVVLAAAAGTVAAGTIQGTVVNTSSGTPIPCQVTVGLQVLVNGQYAPLREIISDQQGRFAFQRLPVDERVVYRAGAIRHGVFHPGPQIRLTELAPIARVDLSVCDAVSGPSPLVLKKMEIVIRPETGLLKVTESLLLENPTHTCYVGLAAHDDADPVTLELSIPPDFERTTFEQEFFGRRFALVNHKLVTGIPWPPGQRELRYTYVLPNTQEVSQWRRPMDLPCADVTVRVEGKPPDEVRCEMLRRIAGEKAAAFASASQELAAGQVLQVELGRLPVPWMTYGKWAALAVMLGLIGAAGWFHFRGGKRQSPAAALPKPPIARNRRKRAA